ncbi:MAG: hypothetical protein MUE33_10260 [Cytophagaceae bacterium]|nr:hypothetical protein [Cytophagaceae bacterium]
MSLLTWIVLCFFPLLLNAQTDYFQLSKEYYNNHDYEKAYATYTALLKKEENIYKIYPDYLETLYQLRKEDEAEKIIRKLIKAQAPDNEYYRVDLALHFKRIQLPDKATKEITALANDIARSEIKVNGVGQYLIQRQAYDWAEQVYLTSRKNFDRYAYSFELASLYKRKGDINRTFEELINYALYDPAQLETVQRALQNELSNDEDYQKLETVLYERINKEPNEVLYNELLLWLSLQQKNFSKALTQAKALDKRQKGNGAKIMDVADIARENKDYTYALEGYQYIVTYYKDGYYYNAARKQLIQVREEQIKNTYPIDRVEVQRLLVDYKKLITERGINAVTVEALRNMALLYAFYENRTDTAKVILESVTRNAYADKRLVNRCKLDLGDIYLLDAQPWESTLLYSQVEKEYKEDPMGHEAKLRNAKLYYYKGEFELAQEQLDVLKLATTREISNDAIRMSIFIQENIGMDSTEEAMQRYAAIELMLFRQQLDLALSSTELLLKEFPRHSLTDDIYWLRANILRRMSRTEAAIVDLEKIKSSYAQDILGDDAAFLLAEMYDYDVKNKERAMDLYQKFLIEYPGSIYTADARKRFRVLRGDKVN